MKTSTVVAVFLGIALIVSNGFWLYHMFDQAITITYMGVSLEDNQKALAQALKIIEVSSRSANKSAIIAAMSSVAGSPDSFEKDGYLWIGRLGLKFSPDDKLIEAVPAWE